MCLLSTQSRSRKSVVSDCLLKQRNNYTFGFDKGPHIQDSIRFLGIQNNTILFFSHILQIPILRHILYIIWVYLMP